jgi:hypothetical protein
MMEVAISINTFLYFCQIARSHIQENNYFIFTFFCPDDGCSYFLRNDGTFLPDYTMLNPRRFQS